ncbi:NAD(P)-binding protein [Pluteus cervinus]|uniref:NAD(P)-binding protein n=1 Tax=Pluteus cervinus TaxID=181527 RepID=A0ACD3B3S7_9AGAR|nr:NAD(P)-binding protein [Pluteus cervinus]
MLTSLARRCIRAPRVVPIPQGRSLSASPATAAARAIVYSGNGNPSEVLSVLTFPDLPPPPTNTLNVQFLLSPINPADINVIEGVYPSKPKLNGNLTTSGLGSQQDPVFVGGNEGLARVSALGSGVEGLQEGDWVVMKTPQVGTWRTSANVKPGDVLKVPSADKLTPVQAATLVVNPPTAWNLLHDFVQLSEGDWVIQNGANSAVGQCVIQVAAAKGYKTINLVRNRSDLPILQQRLRELGATEVLTYDELAQDGIRDKIKSWTNGKDIKLGLNCVGGPDTTRMARFLGKDAHLVSYGAMSKAPLSLPTSLFIFKNLTSHGFWQSRWYADHSLEEQQSMLRTLTELMANGKLLAPDHEIASIRGSDSDEVASEHIRSMVEGITSGQYGKKVLLQFESDEA